MALLKCSECEGQVSELAKNCPHCGAPVSLIKTPIPTPKEFRINKTTFRGITPLDDEVFHYAIRTDIKFPGTFVIKDRPQILMLMSNQRILLCVKKSKSELADFAAGTLGGTIGMQVLIMARGIRPIQIQEIMQSIPNTCVKRLSLDCTKVPVKFTIEINDGASVTFTTIDVQPIADKNLADICKESNVPFQMIK